MVEHLDNAKARAWDLIGAAYWNAGYRGGPSERDIELYLDGCAPGSEVAVIGASTRYLIGAAVERGLQVTVIDFSVRMCADLAKEIAAQNLTIIHHDMTKPVPDHLVRKHDFVLADRLINRFTEAEAVLALREMLRLLNDGGEIRTAIRLGLYDRDLPLIEAGRKSGTLSQFFDSETMTIDYGKAGPLLDEHLPAHGNIPRDVLLAYYRWRGPEKRFSEADIERYVAAVTDGQRGLTIAAAGRFIDAQADTLYRFRPRLLPIHAGGQKAT